MRNLSYRKRLIPGFLEAKKVSGLCFLLLMFVFLLSYVSSALAAPTPNNTNSQKPVITFAVSNGTQIDINGNFLHQDGETQVILGRNNPGTIGMDFELNVSSSAADGKELIVDLPTAGVADGTHLLTVITSKGSDEIAFTIGAVGPQGLAGLDGADGAAGADGDDGAVGPPGPAGVLNVVTRSLQESKSGSVNNNQFVIASCNSGEVALGGGCASSALGWQLIDTHPFFAGKGWLCEYNPNSSGTTTSVLTAYARCAGLP
jgi:hypothetical protein